jgi:hypothetical protein
MFFFVSPKTGLSRDLNPGPLAPKARIIPLDHWASDGSDRINRYIKCARQESVGKKYCGSGGIRTHASEETGALNQRLRPLGHATLCVSSQNTPRTLRREIYKVPPNSVQWPLYCWSEAVMSALYWPLSAFCDHGCLPPVPCRDLYTVGGEQSWEPSVGKTVQLVTRDLYTVKCSLSGPDSVHQLLQLSLGYLPSI